MTLYSIPFFVACMTVASAPPSLAIEPEYVVGAWNAPSVKSDWASLLEQGHLVLTQDERKSYSGWYNPNLNGGRMLDVRMNGYKYRFLHSIHL